MRNKILLICSVIFLIFLIGLFAIDEYNNLKYENQLTEKFIEYEYSNIELPVTKTLKEETLCVTPPWQYRTTCTWQRPTGEQTHICYGEDEYCEMAWIGEMVPQCKKRRCKWEQEKIGSLE